MRFGWFTIILFLVTSCAVPNQSNAPAAAYTCPECSCLCPQVPANLSIRQKKRAVRSIDKTQQTIDESPIMNR